LSLKFSSNLPKFSLVAMLGGLAFPQFLDITWPLAPVAVGAYLLWLPSHLPLACLSLTAPPARWWAGGRDVIEASAKRLLDWRKLAGMHIVDEAVDRN
jgi:hypothetical protein